MDDFFVFIGLFPKVNESQYKQCGVNPKLFLLAKSIEKYWEKIDTDIINWEKFFDRSADDTYKAIYRYSLTLSMKTYTNRNNM